MLRLYLQYLICKVNKHNRKALNKTNVTQIFFKQDKLIGLMSTAWNIFVDDFFFTKSSPPEVFLKNSILTINSKFTGEYPCMPKCDFNRVALQLYRNHTLV